VVRSVFASVEDGVTEATNFILHIESGSDAVVRDFSGKHIIEILKILFNRVVLAGFALNHFLALQLHLLLGSIVSVSVALSDHLAAEILNLLKVIRRVSDSVGDDVESLEVGEHALDKLVFFIGGVGVVETEDHLTLVHFSVVVIEHGCLDVTNVEVARGLWGETSDNFAHFGAEVLENITDIRVFGVSFNHF
jgi:hypothetical protein